MCAYFFRSFHLTHMKLYHYSLYVRFNNYDMKYIFLFVNQPKWNQFWLIITFFIIRNTNVLLSVTSLTCDHNQYRKMDKEIKWRSRVCGKSKQSANIYSDGTDVLVICFGLYKWTYCIDLTCLSVCLQCSICEWLYTCCMRNFFLFCSYG